MKSNLIYEKFPLLAKNTEDLKIYKRDIKCKKRYNMSRLH